MTQPFDVDHLDLRPSSHALELRDLLIEFMQEHVFPAEADYHAHRCAMGVEDHTLPR